jgi:hypothetical protein
MSICTDYFGKAPPISFLGILGLLKEPSRQMEGAPALSHIFHIAGRPANTQRKFA